MGMLIRNALLITQNEKREVKKGDILIEGERIAEVGSGIDAKAEEVIDANGKILLPGLVNTHTHLAMTLFRGYADEMGFFEAWPKLIWPKEAKLNADDVRWGSLLGCAEMIKSGTTSFSDMYFFMDETARAVEESGMRALLGHGMIDLGKPEKREKELAEGERFVRAWSGKNERIIPCFTPHAPYTCSLELLQKTRELARKYKTKVHIHLNETRKEVFDSLKAHKKRPIEYMEANGLLSENVLAAHCVWVTKEEIKILAKNNVSVSHNPVSNMKLASGGVSPVPEMLAENVRVSLGTDGAVSNNSLDMFDTMKVCALLHKHAREDASILSAQQVLDFATRNGAKALGINAGSIEKGKLADIILLDANAPNMRPLHNPVSQIVYSANAGNVSDVIVHGRFLMRDRKLLTLDEEKIIQKAQEATEDLLSR